MRTAIRRWNLVVLAAVAAFAVNAGAQEKPAPAPAPAPKAEEKQQSKVAVRAFAAKGVDASVAGTIETAFCDSLSKQFSEVVCSDDIKALMQMRQADLGLGNCESEEECTKQVAKIAEASRVVTGEVSKLGEQFIVSVTLIDATSSKVLGRASDKTPKIEGLLEKLDELAKRLATAAASKGG